MYAVILIPSFRLQVALRWRTEIAAKPVAVVDTSNDKSVILECNELAYRYGLSDGMNCTQGLARCPNLELVARAEKEELTGQAILLETGFSLTPELEETEQGCITLDISKIKIDDYSAWANEIIERLELLNFQVSIGIGPNPDLAYLAAKKAQTFLLVTKPSTFIKNLAVADIEQSEKLVSLLRDWGITTLGQLTKLPKRELAARLGHEAGILWDKASGKTMRLLKLAKQREDYSESYEFEYQVETIEPVYFIVNRFLKSLTLRLEGINRVAKAVELTLKLDNAPDYKRNFSIPAPTRNAITLLRIINTHLESLTLSNSITGLELRIEPAKVDNNQLSLFDSAIRDLNKFLETLARIIAVVGFGKVGTAFLVDNHKPDDFVINEPQFDKLPEGNEETYSVGLPLKRYRPAIPAQVVTNHHVPTFIRSEKAKGNISERLGPYRIAGSWWQNRWGTEEWDIEIPNQGLYRISCCEGKWYIEGCYDA